MRSIWITSSAGPTGLEVRESPDPVPGPGQVRVRVRAAGLCFAEVMAAQGLYPDRPKPPCVMGYEVAGVIDAVGDGVADDLVDSRVIALTRYGGHSDVVCVPAGQALPIPDGKDFEEAAALPVNYLTAYHMLFRVACVRPGERVLVHMAAGGVGTAVLQLCRTIDGVVTFGTASAAKHEALRAEGCTHPIDYRTADYAAEVRRLTNGEGVDVVLDSLGGADWRKGLKLLRPVGRLVAYGFANLASGQRRRPVHVLSQVASMPRLTPAAADEPQQERLRCPHRATLGPDPDAAPGTGGGAGALGSGPHHAADRRHVPVRQGGRRPPPDPVPAEHRQDRADALTGGFGGVRHSVVQAGEVGDHLVDAGDLENAQHSSGRHRQQHRTTLSKGPLVRIHQDTEPGGVTEPGPGHVDHERR